jgi:hypothetical protein
MKTFILTRKGCPEYSHEIYVVMASDKKQLEEIVTTSRETKDLVKSWGRIYNFFDIKEISQPGVVYTDIY